MYTIPIYKCIMYNVMSIISKTKHVYRMYNPVEITSYVRISLSDDKWP